ncbi:transcription termination factor 2 isoform X2 [Hippocampus comes]|uniref:transcription termination factor 2 isoform X2 n=1 Tax=Hippocampus comes TaxID=109280 RepID=UPI00094EF02C|nr:PREDICTED: transcription termination factor 2 isoform X2 [Hippocampus comes]
MDKVTCDVHGGLCMLKTGVKDGPSKGKSFYVCVDKRGCNFSSVASISASRCLQHEDSIVELQALMYSQQEECDRLFYRCVEGKKAGQRWCGNVPWAMPEKDENKCKKSAQPSCLPPVRNPFKAPEKLGQESQWRRMQRESESKDNMETKSRAEEGEGEGRPVTPETYRGQHLPAGMKLKKKSVDKTHPPSKSDMPTSGVSMSVPKSDMTTSKGSVTATNISISVPKSDMATSKGSVETASVSTCKLKNKMATSGVSMFTQKSDNAASGVSLCMPKSNMTTSNVSPSVTKSNTNTSIAATAVPKSEMPTSGVSMSAPKNETVSFRGPAVTERSSPSVPNTNMATSKGSIPMSVASTTVPQSEMVAFGGSSTPSISSSPPKSEMVASGGSDNSAGQWRPRQSKHCQDDDDEDFALVSVKPPQKPHRTLTSTAIQKPLTSYSAFQPASHVMHKMLSTQLQQKKATLAVVNVAALPDKGERLRTQVRELEAALESLNLTPADDKPPTSQVANPFSRPGGTILIPAPPAPGPHPQPNRGFSQMHGEHQAFYGGRMTDNRLLAVKNATCKAIDHLHTSLESCPSADAEAPDPRGLRVSLLAHQRRALAWLLWREAQNPCGGILADDMGLGKTLTMIALILAQKSKVKAEGEGEGEEEEEEEEKKQEEGWLSKTDCRPRPSKGTLVICPASLVHHWKKEIERHVKAGRLSVYLYHGPDRNKNARVLAQHDVVVTTYALVSREAPGQKEADQPNKEAKDAPAAAGGGPLMRVAWARVILDEAHNIKNPKVQQSMAVCQLRAAARWAVTGTPIQNNLLDMYSLLKFLRCAPFDEYKLWKAQVNNGSKRGRERLNILTRTLLLRRTKNQQDSSGKPLVALPDRTCKVHQLKLSEDEQAVYDVVFAQSRSTLQNYLKRHEGNDVKGGSASASNPFDKVSQELVLSQSDLPVASSQQPQRAASTAHILSLLLRLRQCCCHLSLLKKTLDSSELQGDDVVLTLEEQLNALSLTSASSPSDGGEDMVGLNGTRFPSRLFDESSRSSKISAIVLELEAIRASGDNQKSVIMSQWTSMLCIMAVHLKQMGLRYGVIDGTVNPKRRMDLVEEFNTNPKGPQVMLVSLCAGGVGLNLIGGNHLFLMDMHWNPALEDQACDRIYRVGQRRDVTIHRFECEGTVEQKIATLHAKKKELAQSVLSGTGNAVAKLSLADLKIIFGV